MNRLTRLAILDSARLLAITPLPVGHMDDMLPPGEADYRNTCMPTISSPADEEFMIRYFTETPVQDTACLDLKDSRPIYER